MDKQTFKVGLIIVVLLTIGAIFLSGCKRPIPFSTNDVHTWHDNARGVTCFFVTPPNDQSFGLGCVVDSQYKK